VGSLATSLTPVALFDGAGTVVTSMGNVIVLAVGLGLGFYVTRWVIGKVRAARR